MTLIISQEYRNENARRAYPFEDNATLADTKGNTLPTDFITDLHMFPMLRGASTVYLKTLDLTANRLYFYTVDGTYVGYCDMTAIVDGTPIYEPEYPTGYNRCIGTIMYGDGLTAIAQGAGEGNTREFLPVATTLVPTAITPTYAHGIRGFELPDGTIVTGNVVFAGENGVEVTGSLLDNSLEINFVGVTPDNCDEDIPIRQFTFQGKGCFSVSSYVPGDTSVLAISTGFTLGGICANRKSRKLPDVDGNLPDDNGPCPGEPTPTPEPTPDPGCQHTGNTIKVIDVTTLNGDLQLITPAETGDTNPLSLKAGPSTPAPAARPQFKAAADVSKLAGIINRMSKPLYTTRSLVFSLLGLSKFKRGTPS